MNENVEPMSIEPSAMDELPDDDGTKSEFSNYSESDNYKPEGTIILKIDHFSDFARGIDPYNPSSTTGQRLSAPVYIRNLPWKILAMPREMPLKNTQHRRQLESENIPRYLGFFLQCNGEATDGSWLCVATATLTIVSQKEGVEDNSRKIQHSFHIKENDWGYSQFISCEALLDPNNGYIVNDTVVLSAHVNADAPHGVHWDSKKHAGYIGLKNQGATCYMNSLLQTLFFTNKLRKAVYMMPTEEDDPDNSVALAMQRVFYELQFSDVPVGTKKLTKSFGWDSVESFLQHDVQELCRVLLDNLETKMKSTVVSGTIPSLFEGQMKSYIKCTEVEFESSREESFYDVQLNVKGQKNVIDSFREYTNPEILDGDNKYDAGNHGLQRAKKGVKFMSFPPVLHLQLMRFQYDAALDANVKVNDRFEFPEELNLDEFIDEHGKQEDYTYLLHAVLVHSGDFHGGHYVVFINTNVNGKHKWCKFDDDVVSRAALRDVVQANFGGEEQEFLTKACTNAYMLVYVRKNAVDDVLCSVSADDIPQHLKTRFEKERKRDQERKREKEEATHFTEISLITDEELKNHIGFDLFDPKELEDKQRKMKIEKNMNAQQIYQFIGDNLNLHYNEFRLWAFGDYVEDRTPFNMKKDNYEVIRPTKLLGRDNSEQNGYDNTDLFDNYHMLYLEMPRLNSDLERELPDIDNNVHYLTFLKFYNAERNVVEYKGVMFLRSDQPLLNQLPHINALLGLSANTRLKFYSEYRPDDVYECSMTALVRDDSKLCDGAVLIAEIEDQTAENRNAREYYKQLYNQIEVEAFLNQDGFGANIDVSTPPNQPIRGIIGLNWKLHQIAEWIGQEINFDPARILLWKLGHNEKPTNYVNNENMTVHELLALYNYHAYDPRAGRCYKLFYSKMPIPVAELENRRPTRVIALFGKFQTTDITVFPEKSGTVQSLLDEVARDFNFSENGTKQLRLVHANTMASCLRVFQIFPKDMPLMEVNNRYMNSLIQLRVEEIPPDQLEIREDEHLLPVAHFDKEPCRMFGVPFFIKITEGEKIANIKRRIKELLEVPDREFEKYKFFIVVGSKIMRDFDTEDENAVVHCKELFSGHISSSPTGAAYLGIDHMNKSRGVRGNHVAEKPIIIHN